jgi:Tfp pilus assembly protein PilV
MNRTSSTRGVTLVEVMISFIILTLAVLPVLKVFSRDASSVTSSWLEFQQAAAGRDLMEQIRRTRWDQNSAPGTVLLVVNATNPLAQELPGVRDDVDDWNGYTDTVTARWKADGNFVFRRSVVVDYVDVDAGGTVSTAAVTPSNYKRVRVTVRTDGRPDDVLVNILANLSK